MTDIMETDAFAELKRIDADTGGFYIDAADESAARALLLRATSGGNTTTKTTAALGTIQLEAGDISGSSNGPLASDSNLVVISNNGTTRFIFDAEGTGHADDVWSDTAFDLAEEYDIFGEVTEGTVLTVDAAHGNRLSRSAEAYQVVTGIVSYHTPQLSNAFNNIMEKYPQLQLHEFTNPQPVALTGVVPTLVTNDNGNVEIGDLLVTSSTPGVAMRVDDKWKKIINDRFVVGVALMPCDAQECVINLQR